MNSMHLGRVTLAVAAISIGATASRMPLAAAPTAIAAFDLHHVHLNVVDPARSIEWYTTRFDQTRRTTLAGFDALQSENVYLLFNKVSTPAGDTSQAALWHFGWNAPDLMP